MFWGRVDTPCNGTDNTIEKDDMILRDRLDWEIDPSTEVLKYVPSIQAVKREKTRFFYVGVSEQTW